MKWKLIIPIDSEAIRHSPYGMVTGNLLLMAILYVLYIVLFIQYRAI